MPFISRVKRQKGRAVDRTENAGKRQMYKCQNAKFWYFDYATLANLTNLLHPGFQGVRWTRDQPMPGPFPTPPPSQGKGPGPGCSKAD